MEEDLLILHLGSKSYSLPLEQVGHIFDYSPHNLVPIPLAPPPILGLAYGSGRVLTVVDLGALLGMPPLDLAHDHTLMALSGNYRDLAFLLGNMEQILTWVPSATIDQEQETALPPLPEVDFSQVLSLSLPEITAELSALSLAAKEALNGHKSINC